jgi:hypothetical protein
MFGLVALSWQQYTAHRYRRLSRVVGIGHPYQAFGSQYIRPLDDRA